MRGCAKNATSTDATAKYCHCEANEMRIKRAISASLGMLKDTNMKVWKCVHADIMRQIAKHSMEFNA